MSTLYLCSSIRRVLNLIPTDFNSKQTNYYGWQGIIEIWFGTSLLFIASVCCFCMIMEQHLLICIKWRMALKHRVPLMGWIAIRDAEGYGFHHSSEPPPLDGCLYLFRDAVMQKMILEYWFAATNTGIWLTDWLMVLLLVLLLSNERTNERKDQLAQHMQSITSRHPFPIVFSAPAKLPYCYSIPISQRCNNTGRCMWMCQNAVAPVNQHSNRERFRFDPTAVCHLSWTATCHH